MSDAGDLKVPLLIASAFTRLARQLDPSRPTDGDLDGLGFKEPRHLLLWPPVLHRVVGALGLLLFVVTPFGDSGFLPSSLDGEEGHGFEIGYVPASEVIGGWQSVPKMGIIVQTEDSG
jgi:hypothetical protein